MINNLQETWTELASKYSSDPILIKDLFQEIEVKYSEKNRFYHNLNHIDSLLSLSQGFKGAINNIDVVDFSIWYHDIVYNAWKKNNEAKSADLAENHLKKLSVPDELINKVKKYILSTKNHTTVITHDYDEMLFLDFDLSILGADPDIYKVYTENIRKEYVFVPYIFYKRGRLNFLEKTMQSPIFFKTKEFASLYQIKALENISNEIKDLKGLSKSVNKTSDFILTITDEEVKIEHPKRKTEQIKWGNITEIYALNTDQGPFLPDIWICLMGNNEGCVIPIEATNYELVYERVSKFEGFDFENYISSMGCTDNQKFILWEKK